MTPTQNKEDSIASEHTTISNGKASFGRYGSTTDEEVCIDRVVVVHDDSSHSEFCDSDDPEELRNELLSRTNHFDLPVSAEKGFRATQLSFFSFRRPHMRAFHGSWMCFCCAWLIWFSIAPLLETMAATSIPMTKSDIWTSNLCALVGTIFVRITLGPMCDERGGKDILTGLLAACAIPCLFSGLLIQDYSSLLVVRAAVGCVGGTLVPAQFWITSHFTPECSGVAMACAAGWGAIGGGMAQIFMGSFLYPLLRNLFDGDEDLAWRVSLTVPASIALGTAYFFYKYSDDCPLGTFHETRAAGLLQQRSALDSFRKGILNVNAWILFCQFGACHGIELVMDSGLTAHLSGRFNLPIHTAAAFASLFGLMNVFARGLGGYISDRLHKSHSLKGRFYFQMTLLLLEGILIFGFVRSDNTLASAIAWLVGLASIGQMAMASTFGIIPYIDPRCTGTIAGLVGAGGNVGGVLLSNNFRRLESEAESFTIMAYSCFFAALITPLLVVYGYRGILWGEEASSSPATLLTPAARIAKR